MPTNLEALDTEVLIAENQRLANERTAIGDQQDEIMAVLNKRAADEKAAAILEGLTPGQRDVLVQAATAMAGTDAEAPGEES